MADYALRLIRPTATRCAVITYSVVKQQTHALIPAARSARVLQSRRTLLDQRAQGKPGANCTRSLACDWEEHTSEIHHRFSRGQPGFPRAKVFTVSFVLSPVSGLFCHRRHVGLTTRLDARVAAPGPHDFAVRSRANRLGTPRPSHPAPNVTVTMAIRPSEGHGMDHPYCKTEFV